MNEGLLGELQDAIGDAYAIERELGGGGMSSVFLATERSLGRRVVIKVLPPEMVSGVSEARFRREILVTANLQHPHILPVLAAGLTSSLHYYITPFVEGQSLRNLLTLQGALPIADGLQILRELASALAHAHANGVIHRDVKPENILLSGGHVVLADFGIAAAMLRVTQGEKLTRTGQGPGTPGYMAPEQLVDASSADARVDVFAVGVVAYEMLSGKAPFSGLTPHALAASYFTEPPVPLRQLRPEVPAAVSAAITRALATSPADRFANASEFLDAIRPTLEGGPQVVAGGRRRASRVAAVVVAAVALAGALLVAKRFGSRVPNDAVVDRKMLAVLPFKNLGRPEDAYFATGVTEEVTSRLASVSGLGVISRTSADQYAGSTKTLRVIARELGADYILEGSVRWEHADSGTGRVRVTPQLIRVRDDTHLWSFPYQAELKDVFTVQSQIAEEVAGALAIALPSAQRQQMDARPTENLAAYDAYIRGEGLRARESSSPTSQGRAEKLLEQAASADPRFALAFAKLALVHIRTYESFADRSSGRLAKARAAADSALALSPNLPDAHLAQGRYFEATDDLEHASAEYALAEQGRPNDSAILISHASVMARRGAWNDAINRFRRAAELDPRSVDANGATAVAAGMMHNYTNALLYIERAIAADSDGIDAYITKARLEIMVAGDWPRARETVRGIILRFGAERAVVSDGFDAVIRSLDTADLAALERVNIAAFGNNPILYHYWRVVLYERWRPELARAHADTLNRLGDRLRADQPNSFRVFSAGAFLNSILGNREQALAEARRALALVPRTRDAVAWSDVATSTAASFVRVGETEAAIDHLEQLIAAPSWVNVAWLRRDPFWDPLRAHPRFQRLLARGP